MSDHGDDHHGHGPPGHDLGLRADLATLATLATLTGRQRRLGRRGMLGLLGGAGLAGLVGCAPGTDAGAGSAATSTASTATGSTGGVTTTAAGSCEAIPEETAGPYPADGSNGPDVLGRSGVVRGDIRSSFGSASGTAEGVPLTVTLTVLDLAAGCAPFAGAAVYLWHCDRDGGYSMYSPEIADQNYLRGVQAAGRDGGLTFTSIFPAAYSGRWPHLHFEVYPSLGDAAGASGRLATSQLALPADVCDTVYATDGYARSAQNLRRTSLDTDMVFRDGHRAQLATVTGSVADGYAATLTVAV
ncbi:MAG TPA: intradiol ring-cleavage dioxygenase [Pseudonocardiaceae bacterium]